MKEDTDQAMLEAVGSPEFQQMAQSLSRFNVFQVLRCAGHEIRHSNILAWLLDPNESHELGAKFLQRVLDGLALPVPQNIQSVTVRREWNNIDILIELVSEHGQWVICIENKFNATQGEGQLKRYRKAVEQVYPGARQTFVFLTLREEKPHDDAYLSTSYAQIREQLLKVLEESIAAEPRMLIEHYLAVLNERLDQNSKSVRLAHEICRRYPKAVEVAQSIVEPGRGTPRLNPQARQVYDAHRTAFDHVLKHRKDRNTEVTGILKAMMETEGKEQGWEPVKSESRIIRFVHPEWLKLAGKDKDSIPPLFCAIHLAEDLPRLRFVAGSSAPQDWKDKLAHRSREWDLPGAISEARKQGGIYAFYIEPLSDVRETASDEEAASRIWREVISAMSRPEIREMIEDVVRVLG